MKIEKISDNQIKIILSRADLNERNIDLIELVNGSDKTHELLKELMEQALVEHDFQISNAPLVIEAAPLSVDSLMLIVTKVEDETLDMDFENSVSLLSEIAKYSGYKKKHLPNRPKPKRRPEELHSMFSFTTLDDVVNASVRLYNVFWGESLLAKNKGRYYLYITNNQENERIPLKQIDTVLGEYGNKHTANHLSEYYLKEHGEVLIPEFATIKLAEHLGGQPNGEFQA